MCTIAHIRSYMETPRILCLQFSKINFELEGFEIIGGDEDLAYIFHKMKI